MDIATIATLASLVAMLGGGLVSVFTLGRKIERNDQQNAARHKENADGLSMVIRKVGGVQEDVERLRDRLDETHSGVRKVARQGVITHRAMLHGLDGGAIPERMREEISGVIDLAGM